MKIPSTKKQISNKYQ